MLMVVDVEDEVKIEHEYSYYDKAIAVKGTKIYAYQAWNFAF